MKKIYKLLFIFCIINLFISVKSSLVYADNTKSKVTIEIVGRHKEPLPQKARSPSQGKLPATNEIRKNGKKGIGILLFSGMLIIILKRIDKD